MLKMKFKEKIGDEVIYDWKEEVGTVAYNVVTRERRIIKLTSYDKYGRIYMGHAFQAIGYYVENNHFPEKDLVAWY